MAGQDARIDAEAERLLASGYQVTLDAIDVPPPIQLPDWLRDPLTFLLRVGILVAAALLIWLFVTMLLRRRVPRDEAEPESFPPQEAAWVEDGLRQADTLAANGRFAEALHLLLLAALSELVRRGRLSIADSLTSREILHRVPVPASVRPPLSNLVRGVELSLFGGRLCDADAYRDGRRHFETVSAELTGGVT